MCNIFKFDIGTLHKFVILILKCTTGGGETLKNHAHTKNKM